MPSSDFDRSDNEDDNAEDDDNDGNDDIDEESESDDQTTETPSVNNNLSTTAATTPTPVASRCQFSQHFKSSFIVKKEFFFVYSLSLCLKVLDQRKLTQKLLIKYW